MGIHGDVGSQVHPFLVTSMSNLRLFGSSKPPVSGITPRNSILGASTQSSRVVGGKGSAFWSASEKVEMDMDRSLGCVYYV